MKVFPNDPEYSFGSSQKIKTTTTNWKGWISSAKVSVQIMGPSAVLESLHSNTLTRRSHCHHILAIQPLGLSVQRGCDTASGHQEE